ITAVVTVEWMVITYSLAFREGGSFIGGLDRFWLSGMDMDAINPLGPTIPESVYMCFQMTFAIITSALIVRSMAERMQFSALLWVGWFGFNAGSAVASNGRAGMAMAVTQIATAAAVLGWMFAEWLINKKPSVLGAASGAVAGLVAITPASGFVLPGGALVIGI